MTVTKSITEMFKNNMMKRTIVNFQQINGKCIYVPDEANAHKVRVSSIIDC